MSTPLEDYALLGDGHTAALISRDGSLDWLCWPRFDSEACFAKLLGNAEHGHWWLGPSEPEPRASRRYLPDTMILESTYESAAGAVQVLDFMVRGASAASASSLVRLVVGLRGRLSMRTCFAPRFDYGSLMPWVEPREQGLLVKAGPNLILLHTPVSMHAEPRGCTAEFSIRAGERVPFVITHGLTCAPLPEVPDAEEALRATSEDWRGWIGRFQRPTDWPEAVRRSLLVLRTLIHYPTGGLLAAPTTSLPARFGGSKNWDYRFSWLRDSTFMLTALLNAGYRDEAAAWRDWLLLAIAGEPAKLRTLYRVDGTREVVERELPWLPGYADSKPVRIGNAAAYQHQNDIYGEVMDSLELGTRAGIEQSPHGRQVERGLLRYLEAAWNKAGQGLWESRGEPHHYTYSRVMAWVGVDRFLRSAERFGHVEEQALCGRLRTLRRRIYDEVLREGFDPHLGHFVQHYGGTELDASLLLLPLVGFIRADDPRMAGTISAIERELMQDGLMIRQSSAEEKDAHTAFLACNCWLADCRRMQGRIAEAREAVERVLAVSNDLGLLSEQYSITDAHQCGNFPQALSHLAVVNAGLALAGPVLQRGGG